ncbi:universal stress protein [Olivibacter sp. LS-1]|uniref:universal stress protein n=1 Tax=Olivibacter sp. LS-1 TaxID=2592345 RepID=UPI0011EAB1B7|nr:universal stress protein [Olivibacter sp. LS-1]QEL02670.1 universal stress protein [Olivibacter sp. LS-1]
MRTVLVPTDFSAPAYNAALYAVEMAITLQASLHLVHVMEVADKALLDTQILWPVLDYQDVKEKANQQMNLLKQQLRLQIIENNAGEKVSVTSSLVEGVVYQEIAEEIVRNAAILLVAAMHGAGNAERFIFGSKSRDFIRHISCPVLLIPHNFKYRKINKIAFATDLSPNDIALIELLAKYAEPFHAEIVISHVTTDANDGQHQQQTESFLREVAGKNNYDRIYYRYLSGQTIEDGILRLSENGEVDVLTMVHRPESGLAKLWQRSHTKQIAKQIKIPLLVLKGASINY